MATPTQLNMSFANTEAPPKIKQFPLTNNRVNKLASQDHAFHNWYRWVLSFPPHLVRTYIKKFKLNKPSVILDPFCGTGTTLIEAKLAGMKAIGIEGNPFAHLASTIKTDWSLDAEILSSRTQQVAKEVIKILLSQGIDDNLPTIKEPKSLKSLPLQAEKLILTNSISPLPLHKTLILFEILKILENEPFYRHSLLALGKALVSKISNLHFAPEVGIRTPKFDVPVVSNWLLAVEHMVSDLRKIKGMSFQPVEVRFADARSLDATVIEANSVDAVITSPPYPNEKDYTRTTRLESVLLGFINNHQELRELKKRLLRSNTRGVYKGDDDDKWIENFPQIQHLAEAIEKRRLELGKDSGFEKLYAKTTKLYFGGMAQHLSTLRQSLRPGAQLAYVVGDQASYLRVMIHTGQILGDIAKSLGYELVAIDLFRTRLATLTKAQLREEIVILRWKG